MQDHRPSQIAPPEHAIDLHQAPLVLLALLGNQLRSDRVALAQGFELGLDALAHGARSKNERLRRPSRALRLTRSADPALAPIRTLGSMGWRWTFAEGRSPSSSSMTRNGIAETPGFASDAGVQSAPSELMAWPRAASSTTMPSSNATRAPSAVLSV
jgi:hypothetical protein